MDDSLKVYCIEMDRKHRMLKNELNAESDKWKKLTDEDESSGGQYALCLELKELWNSNFNHDINAVDSDNPAGVILYRDLVHKEILRYLIDTAQESGRKYKELSEQTYPIYSDEYDRLEKIYPKMEFIEISRMVHKNLEPNKEYNEKDEQSNYFWGKKDMAMHFITPWNKYFDRVSIKFDINGVTLDE